MNDEREWQERSACQRAGFMQASNISVRVWILRFSSSDERSMRVQFYQLLVLRMYMFVHAPSAFFFWAR